MSDSGVTKAQKNAARSRVHYAVLTGKLTPQPCERCGKTPTQAHHDDHSKPLEIRWLCADCHTRADRRPGRGRKVTVQLLLRLRPDESAALRRIVAATGETITGLCSRLLAEEARRLGVDREASDGH